MTTNPSAAASERTREHARVLIHHWKRLTGIQVGIHYAEGDERQLTDLIAAELSAKDAEIEQLAAERDAWRRGAMLILDELGTFESGRAPYVRVRKLRQRLNAARADAVRECVGQLQQLESPDYDHGTQANGFEDGKVAAIDTLESLLNEKEV